MTDPVVLSKGQNIEVPETTHLDLLLGWNEPQRGVDVSALLLTGGRVPSDENFVFYNQPASSEGSVRHLGRSVAESGQQERVTIDLESVPEHIDSIAIAGSTDHGTLAELGAITLTVVDHGGVAIAEYTSSDAVTETALCVAEVYRRNGRWKLRAVGQGWSTGLAGLATDFGVDIDNGSEPELEPAGTSSVVVGAPPPPIGEPAEHDPAAAAPTTSPGLVPPPGSVEATSEPSPSPRQPRRKRGISTVKPAARAARLPQFQLRDNDSWQPARLFSVIGVGSGDEQERRATAAVVSTMQAVKPFARAICSRLGAPVGRVEGYIEVPYTRGEGKVIPDAVLRVARGGKVWTALLEVKTGTGQLQREQLENYLDVARRHKYDTVVSLSNDIPAGAGELPVEVDRRKLTKVELRHLSWADIIHEARMLLAHGGLDDDLQAWVLNELLRYLTHPRSGATEFSDMGPHWVGVRDRAAADTLRAGDAKAANVAGKWSALSRYLAQRLTAELGVPVKNVVPRRLANDADARTAALVGRLATDGVLETILAIPETAGDLTVTADLRRNKIGCATTIAAPNEGTSTKRVSWMLRQLKSAPPALLVEAVFSEPGVAACDRLDVVLAEPKKLVTGNSGTLDTFVLRYSATMGTKRSGVNSGFVHSVTTTVDAFYADVLQPLREWVPAAPQPADLDDTPTNEQ